MTTESKLSRIFSYHEGKNALFKKYCKHYLAHSIRQPIPNLSYPAWIFTNILSTYLLNQIVFDEKTKPHKETNQTCKPCLKPGFNW